MVNGQRDVRGGRCGALKASGDAYFISGCLRRSVLEKTCTTYYLGVADGILVTIDRF
jgi:hypothetical protein